MDKNNKAWLYAGILVLLSTFFMTQSNNPFVNYNNHNTSVICLTHKVACVLESNGNVRPYSDVPQFVLPRIINCTFSGGNNLVNFSITEINGINTTLANATEAEIQTQCVDEYQNYFYNNNFTYPTSVNIGRIG